MRLTIRGSVADYARRFSFVIGTEDIDGDYTHVVAPLTLTLQPVARDEQIQPTMSLSRDEAQSLFEAMWASGIRTKSRNVGDASTIKALEAHISDLRKLLFKVSGISE